MLILVVMLKRLQVAMFMVVFVMTYSQQQHNYVCTCTVQYVFSLSWLNFKLPRQFLVQCWANLS